MGTFDGQGNTIKNLNIDTTCTGTIHAVGLFGWLGHIGTITNLNIDGATINGLLLEKILTKH